MEFTSAGVLLAVEIILVVVSLIIAPRNRRPSSALAWIFLIVALPFVGVGLFLIIGSPKLPRARQQIQQDANERIAELASDVPAMVRERGVPVWLPSIAALNRSGGAMPMLEGNKAELFRTYPEQLRVMIEAIDGATRFVHVEFYILALDPTTQPFFDALGRAIDRGVSVRVLLDHMGSRAYPGFRGAKRELGKHGIEWHLMLPILPLRGKFQRPDLRNHRKLLVVDGLVAFVGSPNLIDPSYERRRNKWRGLRWHDLLVRTAGPIVREVDAVFLTDWFSETGEQLDTSLEDVNQDQREGPLLAQLAPSGPAFAVENNLALFNSLIYAAEKRLSITSPYFIPDDSLLNAITTAARRGVEVELFVGEIGDQFGVFHAQHSYYGALLDAGVRIWRYPKPAILHAKHVSIDGQVAAVGSSNMDMRSFQLDFEITLLVAGRSFVQDLEAIEDGYRAVSRELLPEEWQRRRFWHRVADDLARLTSAVQ